MGSGVGGVGVVVVVVLTILTTTILTIIIIIMTILTTLTALSVSGWVVVGVAGCVRCVPPKVGHNQPLWPTNEPLNGYILAKICISHPERVPGIGQYDWRVCTDIDTSSGNYPTPPPHVLC